MKNPWSIITCLSVFLFPFMALAQTGNINTYTINGSIKGVNSGKIYRLAPDSKVIDSAIISRGKFTIRGKLDLPERKFFQIKPGNWGFQAFVDAPSITLNIDTTGAQHQNDNGADLPIIWQINQTGSPMADVFDAYLKEGGIAEFLALNKKMRLVSKDSVAHIGQQIDSLRSLLPQRIKGWTERYVRQNPASVGGIYVFTDYYHEVGERSASYLRMMLQQFSGAAKASAYYRALQNELSKLENVKAGKTASDFTLLKRDKQHFRLSSTRGSLVLLDFWASWCKPCRANIPNLKALYAKYHHKGLELVGISGDSNWNNWVKALDIEKMPWPQVIDKRQPKTSVNVVSDLYNVPSFPYYVLIDKQGGILLTSDNEGIIAQKIEEVLN